MIIFHSRLPLPVGVGITSHIPGITQDPSLSPIRAPKPCNPESKPPVPVHPYTLPQRSRKGYTTNLGPNYAPSVHFIFHVPCHLILHCSYIPLLDSPLFLYTPYITPFTSLHPICQRTGVAPSKAEALLQLPPPFVKLHGVAAKEQKITYYDKEALLFTTYP